MSEVRQFLGQDGQPKFFFSQEKADKFIEKKKAGDTHHVVQEDNKYVIKPKG